MSNIALANISDFTTAVSTQVRGYLSKGTLQLPANYSAENALKAAALMLPEVKNKDNIPVLKSCTADSIKASLLSMCIQGLNPNKHQCYFIAYGEHLTLQRSYFGDIDVAKQIDPSIEDIFASAVFEGDKFEYTIKRGKVVEINHQQKLENKDKPVVAAYATVVYRDGREISTIMTWKQLMQAWAQSPTKPIKDGKLDPNSTHGKFTEEMAKKTVIHRVCKPIIDSSSDQSLFAHFARQTDDAADAAEADSEAEHANQEYINVENYKVDPDTGEVKESEPLDEPTAQNAPPKNSQEAEPF